MAALQQDLKWRREIAFHPFAAPRVIERDFCRTGFDRIMEIRGIWRNMGGGRTDPVQVPDAQAVADEVTSTTPSDADRLQIMRCLEASDTTWFWTTDKENRLTYLSPNGVAHFPAGRKVIGERLSTLLQIAGDEHGQGEYKPLSFLLSARSSLSAVNVSLREQTDAECASRWWKLSGRAQFDASQCFTGYCGIARCNTELYHRQVQSTRLAEYDALTGLANRRRMNRRLTTSLNALKLEKRPCALIMLDLDRFKQVNDTLGHPAGDELLCQVSQRLQRIAPPVAEIGRLGGDEFQIIIPDLDDRGELGDLANRIIQMISQPYSIEGSRAIIGTSVGLAIAPYDGIVPDDLIKAADLALYAAKGGGRGQFRFYSNDLKADAEDRREIEELLRDAIAGGSLEMHYQPQVSARDHNVMGFEALVRWNHPDKGPIPPAVFIPIAEESNLIEALGAWALQQACSDAAEWPGNLSVSVNVSARQFSSETLPELVAQALSQTHLSPSRLELEITESVFMGDTGNTDEMFASLRRLGIRLALDDFGTGFSSLSYLSRAPFDKIKVDQSFVRRCTEQGSANAAIITAITSLAQAMNMITTGEGVESLDELAVVEKLGVDLIQGFIFSRAVPQADVMEKLNSGELTYQPVGPAKSRDTRRSLFRRIGVVHENHHYSAVLRDISRTGARIEGLLDIPIGTDLALDLGEGQIVICTVKRSQGATQGLAFETPLVSDGAGGLCTRHRVSPYMLAAAGLPLRALPKGHHLAAAAGMQGFATQQTLPRFMQVDMSSVSARAG